MANRVPRTYAEAFEMLDHNLKESDQIAIAQMNNLSDLHFGLGLWIRNAWIYSGRNKYLCEEPNRKESLCNIVDMESDDMLERYQKYLQKKHNIFSYEKNFNKWKKLHYEWLDKCIDKPLEELDHILFHYEKISNNIIGCSLCVFNNEDKDIWEYTIPMKELQEDVNEYINQLEDIVRHHNDPTILYPEVIWDKEKDVQIRYDFFPDRIHGILTCYDVQHHRMVFKAYVDTKNMIRSIYVGLKLFKEVHPRSKRIQQLDVHSDSIENYFAQLYPERSFEYKGIQGRAEMSSDFRYWVFFLTPAIQISELVV